jgi:hypothetical protein
MKLHPHITPEIIVKTMLDPERLPDRQGATTEERLKVQAEVNRIAKAGGIMGQCTGCGEQIPILDGFCCVCGGFVCAACRAREEEGVCDHE